MTLNLTSFVLKELNLKAFRTKAEASKFSKGIGSGIPTLAANRFCMFWVLLRSPADQLDGIRMVEMLQSDGRWQSRAHPGYMSGTKKISPF